MRRDDREKSRHEWHERGDDCCVGARRSLESESDEDGPPKNVHRNRPQKAANLVAFDHRHPGDTQRDEACRPRDDRSSHVQEVGIKAADGNFCKRHRERENQHAEKSEKQTITKLGISPD